MLTQDKGFIPAEMDGLVPKLSRLLSDASNAVDNDSGTVRSCLTRALALLCTDDAASPKTGGLAASCEQRVRKHIEVHLDEPIRSVELAAICRLSTRDFSAAFRQSFGLSVPMFVAQRRLARAEMMMLATDHSLTEIALNCGFCDQAHFSRLFRRIAGSTPGSWRRAHRHFLPPH
jgi:AraC-like DNA-binding protein